MAQVQQSLQGYEGVFTVEEFVHSWSQRSIIARIEGTDDELKNEVLVLGAHLVSLAFEWSYISNA